MGSVETCTVRVYKKIAGIAATQSGNYYYYINADMTYTVGQQERGTEFTINVVKDTIFVITGYGGGAGTYLFNGVDCIIEGMLLGNNLPISVFCISNDGYICTTG